MSYWDECEPKKGVYGFSELDWQMKMIENAGGVVTLCLGVKQPRWPEYHWPTWAITLPEPQKTQALLDFVRATVEWYEPADCIIGYQLENEAVNWREILLQGDVGWGRRLSRSWQELDYS
jgi:beta-galactosidase GanA